MKTVQVVVRLFLCAACATAGWAQAQGAAGALPPASSSKASPALPLVEAEVRKVDAGRALIVLRHGDLPNLGMPPMTMGFRVADRKMLDQVKVGDKVRFQAEIVSGHATITELEAGSR